MGLLADGDAFLFVVATGVVPSDARRTTEIAYAR
jgi:hypothetical protein